MGFLNRYKFWFGIGAGGICALVLFLFVWLPEASENREALLSLQNRADELRRDAASEIMSRNWIQQAERREAELREILEGFRSELSEYYPDLSKRLEDPETGEPAWHAFWDFIELYYSKMNELSEWVKESFTRSPSEFLLIENRARLEQHRRDPLEVLRNVLHIYEKEYWVQKELLGIIIEQNEPTMRIPVLDRFSMQSPRTTDGRGPADMVAMCETHQSTDMFAIWPFSIDITLRLHYLTDLLITLAENPLRIEVVSLSIERAVYNGEEMVKASIRGYIPEYKGVSE